MDLATLEEANRLRESMGLKPLPIPGQEPQSRNSDEDDDDDDDNDDGEEDDPMATLEGRHAAAFDNFKQVQDAQLAKRRREEKAAAVKRAREKAQRHALLEGKTLGDLDDEDGVDADGDAKAWLRGQKKRQKKIGKVEEQQKASEAATAEEERRRRRRAAGASSEGEGDDDLPTGVKVGHDMASLLDGDDQILTLKDATVLDNEDEGDELENLGLREEEQLQERLALKKKRLNYDPLNDDEGSHTILGHYDEEIYGKKRKHFTLDPNAILDLGSGSKGATPGASNTGAAATNGQAAEQQHLAIDDILSGMPSSDYLDASEIKMKKPKKKTSKTKKTRTRGGDDDEGLFPASAADNEGNSSGAVDYAEMDLDDGIELAAKRRKRRAMDAEELFRDDDELQASLALQRREALKKRKRTRPEDVAKQLREEPAAPAENGENGDDGDATPATGGLVIDETAEFINNLKRREDREDDAPRPRKQALASSVTTMEESDYEDVAMKDGGADEEDARNEREGSSAAHHDNGGGLEEEKKISEGLGATLSILRGRGILDDEGGDDGVGASERNARMRAHQKFVTEKRVQLARLEDEARRKREHDRTSGPMSRMSVREREEYARKQNAQREFQTSRMLQDMFNKSYTPNFNLEYVDEHGRELNQKEAFRALSHGFHGKTSGRGKTDKMLKKIEVEKRHMAEGILDASQNVGMSSATAQQLKKRKEAGIRLD
ncbi:hypothetical protein HMPREF1624_08687 [Sporothrix schenckii ATCC 58251]|uniref:DNA binding protein SART-1 n=1 Tax=Sporothrix schenckii (strain ATCC 58251 / de Perez 2211183) TaxID=1391915 RepID=U7PKC7_SPOS1|nr:hypothetical protein HMPREF1624_08687 [Sporothrix schenckii ATCC 58251]